MERLLRVVGRLSEAQRVSPVYGAWTVKEVLAHIAAWDRELARAVDELLAGQRPTFVQYATRAGEAKFNAEAVDASRALSFGDVLDESRSAHDALVHRVEALTEDEWRRSSPYRWGNRTPMTVWSLFDYTYKGATHYGGHAKEIEQWLARLER